MKILVGAGFKPTPTIGYRGRNVYKLVLLFGILLIGSLPFACTPASNPVEKPTSSEGQVKAESSGKEAWEQKWEKTLAEAKKEGKVIERSYRRLCMV